ncbi:hypothetical protein [Niabella hibiscisoli]|uniref:hypothetical protein n=1 Tax=Niabella hibiscisoli TaxID=1825928 RepID=UPI001F0D5535|nr:hypothetical protein [Niabella hibiscisoli]MCH5715490.1 hypothetical protein [Niabella hibiscisoli]
MNLCFFLSLVFCMGVLSCNTQQQGYNDCDEQISLYDSLTLEARFSECGEWGGHKERIVVPHWKTDSASLTYIVYPYNCDSLDYYYGNDTISPAASRAIPLLDTDAKKALTQYMQRLVISKSNERLPGHGNNIFSVRNSSRTLKINLYGDEEEPAESFKQLISELFNDSTRMQH